MKTCTYCGKQYPDDTVICAIDQQLLVDAVEIQKGAADGRQTLPTKRLFDALVRIVVLVLEVSLVLATFVIGWWNKNVEYYVFPARDYIFGEALISFPVLLVGGLVLVIRRQPKWGFTALVFALYAFLLFYAVIPFGR